MNVLLSALLIYYVFALLVLWPAWLICRRAGLNGRWSFMLIVPWLGLLLFSCALAFQNWPNMGASETGTSS